MRRAEAAVPGPAPSHSSRRIGSEQQDCAVRALSAMRSPELRSPTAGLAAGQRLTVRGGGDGGPTGRWADGPSGPNRPTPPLASTTVLAPYRSILKRPGALAF